MTVFNTTNIDYSKQPMFFGEPLNIQRFDVMRYPIFERLTQNQHGFFWRPNEIDCSKEKNDYMKLSDGQKNIFTKTLSYQILLDSVQGRSPALALLPICSLPELESCIITWDFFETIHSQSYTHIIRNVYSNPTAVFDQIMADQNIVDRAKKTTAYYNKFIESLTADVTSKERKKWLYLLMISIGILEGLRFYASFACTFAFGEMKLMEGSAKILKLIARDEAQHFAITKNIIKNYIETENDKEMLEVIEENKTLAIEMFIEAVEEEKAWAEYIFEDGSMIGLNSTLLAQYIEFMANKRMKTLYLEPVFKDAVKQNPLPWMDHWLGSKQIQEAPMEIEKSNYVVGGVNMDVNLDSLKDSFSF